MKQKVYYICWDREDAIGKVTNNFIENIRKRVNIKKINLKSNDKDKRLNFFNVFKQFYLLINLKNKKEIIHFEEPKNLESIISLFIKYKKSVLTVHHIDERKRFFDLSFFISKLKHKSFSRLIAVSYKTKEDLVNKYHIKEDKIKVAYLGVDHDTFKKVNKKVNYLKDKKYILYLGSEAPRKNIENILKAFKIISKKYPYLYLVKAGKPDGDLYRTNTNRLIAELGLKDKVIITPNNLTEDDLPLYYSNAEIFVYPTLKEGFGMPLVEAMSCECPVITSDISPMREIAREQVLVNPYDYKEIAREIDKVLSNKLYRKSLIEKAKIRARDFDWNKFANQILNLYKEL